MSSANRLNRILPGMKVYYDGHECVVKQIYDLNEALLVKLDDRSNIKVKVTDIDNKKTLIKTHPEILDLTNDQWKLVQHRFHVIEPLVNAEARTRSNVSERAKAFNVSTNTVYDWLKRYKHDSLLTSLLPIGRKDKGKSRISSEVDQIINNTIDKEYFDKRRKSIQKVCDEVKRLCHQKKLKAPHSNTIRNRIKALNAKKVMAKRFSNAEAGHKFRTVTKSFPGADYPLSVVQIDHTKLDIILVDDVNRIQIGRPWITLAMDVYSRMVTGFYISFDPPGALSTGLCISHSILTKHRYLANYDIETEWPVWGIPQTIHVDNAKEFRGEMLKMACSQYNINLEWRPVARPEFGGHVERLLGTLLNEIHTLPGTTSSSVAKKGTYKPEKEAALTLSEFEKWFSTYIVEAYHQKKHSGIGMSPLQKYKEGIMGNESSPGIGLPAKITDEERLRIDFLPYEKRTIQNYGLVKDKIYYYHDVLRRWINSSDPNSPKYKQKFIFRYDPRDISVLWFYDPEIKDYFPIPYKDTSKPAISIWELREVKQYLKSINQHEINETLIFSAFEKMKMIEEASLKKSLKARRTKQRKKPQRRVVHKSIKEPTFTPQEIDASDLQPFDDMDSEF